MNALVYIAAFAPDKGESVSTLIADPPPPAPPSRRSSRPTTASSSWTATSSPNPSPATCPAPRPTSWPTPRSPGGGDALAGTVFQPAWRTKRAWYLIATDDRMIPPPAQHAMSERIGARTVEVAASHSVYVSQPDAVSDLIRQAARS